MGRGLAAPREGMQGTKQAEAEGGMGVGGQDERKVMAIDNDKNN